ncbi:MAG: PEP-CTERM sorting domain-containing protein [Sedimentisphaerales bacterium]|nr:PEP-CTERM sorting domain-containing protein [Sedimentisphaerales bacterium]
MKRVQVRTVIVAMLWAAGVSLGSLETIQIDFFPCYAPNPQGAAYDSYWQNAQYAVLNGLDAYGEGIAGFAPVTSVTGVQSFVTSYESFNGVETAGEYGGRASWVFHIFDTEGGSVSLASLTAREFFDDLGGVTHSSYGGPLAITDFDPDRLVGIDAAGATTIDAQAEIVGILGIAGNAWLHFLLPEDDGYEQRFDLLADTGAAIEASQSLWGFSLVYDGQTFAAPEIGVIPEPATWLLLGVGTILLRRKR